MEELNSAIKSDNRAKLCEIAHWIQLMWKLLQMEDTLLFYRILLKKI